MVARDWSDNCNHTEAREQTLHVSLRDSNIAPILIITT